MVKYLCRLSLKGCHGTFSGHASLDEIFKKVDSKFIEIKKECDLCDWKETKKVC
ncbi:MAG: hypothetical protein QXM75_04275 [Candidatus Diapherotrites archaeon]